MSTSQLPTIKEQIEFLLTKQREIKSYYQKEYTDFFLLLDQTTKKAELSAHENSQEIEDLLFIKQIMMEQAQQIGKEIQEDISLLEEQLNAIVHILSLNDKAKEQELEELLLDGHTEPLDLATFKKEVLHELETVHANFGNMLNDFKLALKEGGGRKLALLLEALSNEQNANGEGHEHDDENEEYEEGFEIVGHEAHTNSTEEEDLDENLEEEGKHSMQRGEPMERGPKNSGCCDNKAMVKSSSSCCNSKNDSCCESKGSYKNDKHCNCGKPGCSCNSSKKNSNDACRSDKGCKCNCN